MGYRTSIYIVEKDKLNALKHLSHKELFERIDTFHTKDEAPYISRHDIFQYCDAKEVLELGKYLDNDLYNVLLQSKVLIPFFKDKQVISDLNEDTEFQVAEPEILNHLLKYYNTENELYWKQLKEDHENATSDLEKQKILDKYFRGRLAWSEYRNNVSKNKHALTDSWSFEDSIFNIMYLIKILDFNKYYLVWTAG